MDRFEHIHRLHGLLRDVRCLIPQWFNTEELHTLLSAQRLLTGVSPTCSTANLRRRIEAILQSESLGSGYPNKLLTAVYGLKPTG